ncbi:TlpA family protein disulfide reductase [Tissierella sp. MSJ-40]|uniref:TlpA family protein disulfide reductase n=1 Tax=Tissierella simiarum TaxID=2841534 RepID=A0ABS6E7T5_9FIRM|nr:TlpA disulfide reductase family protein [Tissierella simiarum]MBU5438978.1 TlpA family protein disulfide reductase [Tissierella simiarum]
MNKNIRFLMVAILVMTLAITGCTSKKNSEDLDTSKNDDLVIENEGNTEEVLEVKLPEFNLKDVEGNEVSSEIFNDYEMTIVSFWQSTCGPCMEELEALNVIYDEYKDKGVNVVGIALDDVETMGDKGVKKVIEILDLKFTNVIADEEYAIQLMDYITGTPTAFMVGKNGELLMDPKVGSVGKDNDIEEFKKIVEEIIQK